MNPVDILKHYYDPNSKAFKILVAHGNQVRQKALRVAKKVSGFGPDLNFIAKAAMLHDIGIFLTDTPELGCYGAQPYICHGILGHDLLVEAGWPQFALVCERHIGVGISVDDVLNFDLPLPRREMVPVSIEEQIVCYADKFFSKNGNGSLKGVEKSIDKIISGLKQYGPHKVSKFQKWVEMFDA
jgi:uncharacterized protein